MQGPTAEDDASLALRASEGDGAAFGEIVRRYQAPMVRLCWRYVGPSEAEDLAQEAFVRVFLNMARFDAQRPLAPWLLTIARRLCIDRLRQRRVRPSADAGPDELATGASAESDAAARQEMAALAQALRELPEGQREALVLFHIEELAYKDIAVILEVPMGTVMTWLHRARALLREKLGHEPGSQKLKAGA
jgi:RNA polymerase sigma-70 factor (ECF subfamily)